MVWVIATILLFWMVWTFGLIFSMATIPWSVKIGVPAGKHVGYMGGFTIKVLLVWLSLVETTTLATGTTEDNVAVIEVLLFIINELGLMVPLIVTVVTPEKLVPKILIVKSAEPTTTLVIVLENV